MKITRLKLKNFIGIYNGTGKEEIEINFPNNGVHMNMLLGKNGSGKSTILSQLTPFKDSFDDRKSLILPGKEGLKEIDIEHNGHVYNIKHILKSFIIQILTFLLRKKEFFMKKIQIKLKFFLERKFQKFHILITKTWLNSEKSLSKA